MDGLGNSSFHPTALGRQDDDEGTSVLSPTRGTFFLRASQQEVSVDHVSSHPGNFYVKTCLPNDRYFYYVCYKLDRVKRP
ncbi:hypothetical protein TNCV_4139831 [Trichonephila clavipes]|nr:hypothetical protein TNCV_4139831 [Trichonephila clavipes]